MELQVFGVSPFSVSGGPPPYCRRFPHGMHGVTPPVTDVPVSSKTSRDRQGSLIPPESRMSWDGTITQPRPAPPPVVRPTASLGFAANSCGEPSTTVLSQQSSPRVRTCATRPRTPAGLSLSSRPNMTFPSRLRSGGGDAPRGGVRYRGRIEDHRAEVRPRTVYPARSRGL